MNRNYYCKVNSQEERTEILKKLRELGEPANIDSYIFNGEDGWYYIGFPSDESKWRLASKDHIKNASTIEVPASELIDYVTGKKLDKDALLEEAKRRYPIGTKIKSALKGDKHPFQTIVKENIYLDKVDGRQVIWNGDGCGFIYDDENWAEIIEEPKVEVKEKIKSTITWKIGDYVVFVEDWSRSKKGNIDKIEKLGDGVIALYLEKEGLAGSPLHNDCKLKVFPTLQEAQKFSDELLGKSKTGLRVEDLVEGEIYVNGPDNGTMWCYIIKYSKNSSKKAVGLYKTGVYSAEYCNYMGDYTEGWLLRLATPDEKKWLNTCIRQDKFIEQSELNKYDDEGNLMESEEYPEYYECIKGDEEDFITGKIYKINNPKNLEAPANFIDEKGRENGWCTSNFEHFNPSTKSAYDAQFKKEEDYKVGDYVITKGYNSNYDGRILKITRISCNIYCYFKVIDGGYFNEDSNFNKEYILRKALPHEIPVENSVKQYPYTPEESIKLDFEVKWKEPRYIGGVDSITATGWGIYEQMKKQPIQSRKSPDLIDKSKVEVKIKRTKAKQIKL